MAVQRWLMKSEPDVFSIDDLKRLGRAPWDGVRNFQARNYMKQMKVGDLVLIYHSSADPSGVAGVARVVKSAAPDPTSWDRKSEYFDLRSTPDKPLWFAVEMEFAEKFNRFVTLAEIKAHPTLRGMVVARKGSRLSVTPVSRPHFETVWKLGSV